MHLFFSYLRTMIEQVSKYIEQKKLLVPKQTVMVALSGGADSVALLHILLHLGYPCMALHCNFHLRGEESMRDEAFVRQLCQTLQVELCVADFDTTAEAKRRHISIEMAARELRYAWFEDMRIRHSAQAIAVAHHRDDSAETFLLNLMRGTGINGLKGIRPRNGFVVRPLLCLNRTDITDFLSAINQSFVTDSTNLHDDYLRNKIRLHLLPLMQQINPSAKENILKTASHLTATHTVYRQAIEQAANRVCPSRNIISINALMQETEPENLLFELLYPRGFNSTQITDIYHSLHGQSGKLFSSPGWRLLKDRNSLLLKENETEETSAEGNPKTDIQIAGPTLPKHSSELWALYGLQATLVSLTTDFEISRNRHIACFDADKITSPLHIRPIQTGDWFVPFGMKGRKKLSDYLTNRKLSLFERESLRLLCSGSDIIWLIGERSDNRYRIDKNTKQVLVVEMK